MLDGEDTKLPFHAAQIWQKTHLTQTEWIRGLLVVTELQNLQSSKAESLKSSRLV